HRVTYNKSRLLEGAPRLAFGAFQLYKLTLSYHLKNPSIGLGYTEIALPPDIAGYQRISQLSLLPAPNSLRVDEDGNYLARYNLGPFERKDVAWVGYLALYYPPRSFTSQKISAIEEGLIKSFTGEDSYWETADLAVKAQAARLVDPKKSASQNAEAIYKFVSQTLSYDYEKLASGELVRLGAKTALEEKTTAVCMEYTDLFIALARAGGLPAREVNGYAYTADDTNRPLSLKIREGDVLHAWPQVYLPGTGWVMIDPTWASTSGSDYFAAFDLSHLAFVVKGQDSQYPLPAGSYKTDGSQEDVAVEFSQDAAIVEEAPKLEISIEFSRFAVSPFGSSARVTVKNVGTSTSFSSHLRVKTSILSPSPTQIELGTLPPSSQVEKEITLTPAKAFTKGEETLEVTVKGKDFLGKDLQFAQTATRTVRPFYLPLSYQETFAVLGSLALIFFGRKFLLTRLVR
ncbi:MAG: transglutaminase family protein, partial [Patescibacteria group bacterium]